MPNHLEDIKCQQAKGEIVCYVFFYCSLLFFLSPLVKKKKKEDSEQCFF